MGRWIVSLAVIAALAGAARAEPLAEPSEPPKGESMKKRLEKNVDHLADQLGFHLSRLSFDVLEMSFDMKKKRAKVKLDAGDDDNLGVGLDSDVKFKGDYARVQARLDLSLGGHSVSLDLPEFQVAPSKVKGEAGVEVRLPLVRGRF